MKPDPQQTLFQAIRADGRYAHQAYTFLQQGLDYTARKLFGDRPRGEPRHVTGQELCAGLCELALQRWGRLAGVVLRSWNVHTTHDFGEMVFFLVTLGAMGQQDTDCIEDFDDVYDFTETFDSYHIPLDADQD
ncbi:MAG: Minf_1886 family protein [Planctomycetota bacterium]